MKLKINEKGNYIWVSVERIGEAYGWHDSKTCVVEYTAYLKDEFGNEAQVKKSVLVFENIQSVIRKIEKERATKELKVDFGKREEFSRWKKSTKRTTARS
jgi:hypothetical protein|nr:MAG TPA: hypothetical protein [Caudoviricetes sp.]